MPHFKANDNVSIHFDVLKGKSNHQPIILQNNTDDNLVINPFDLNDIGYTVIVYDFRGTGKSEGDHNDATSTHVNDLHELIHHLNLRAAIIVAEVVNLDIILDFASYYFNHTHTLIGVEEGKNKAHLSALSRLHYPHTIVEKKNATKQVIKFLKSL